MNIIKNKVIKIFLLTTSSLSVNMATAAVCPPVGIVTTLANPALLVQLKSVGLAHDAYNLFLTTQLTVAFGNIQNAVVEQNMKQVEAVLEASNMILNNKTELSRLASETKMDYESYLAAAGNREEAALTPTGNGGYSLNKAYFKNLCSMDKASALAFKGSSSSLDSLLEISNELSFSSSGALLEFEGGNIVNDHYGFYCSEEDKSMNLCKEVAKIPSADILSFVFLNPQNEVGKNVIAGTKFKTEYTYSDYESKAAKSYIEHVVPIVNISRPVIGQEDDLNTISYSARYKQLHAMINLARYAYARAYSNRLPVVKTSSLQLSKLDQMRLISHKSMREDMVTVTNANPKGKMVFILKQLSLESAIDQEISELETINNNLVAALLAEKNNKASFLSEVSRRK